MQRNIILFELNEVPFRILEHYARLRPESALARMMREAKLHETYAEDVGHLSPWRTWPTLHRGVLDDQHTIEDFGQDLSEVDKAFPPLWQVLAKNGVSVGICGTLHSYPPPADLENYAFYLPDTFASGSECFPKKLSAFQEMNLVMARSSAKNVGRGLPWREALNFLKAMPDLGIRMETNASVAQQLLGERFAPWKATRRRVFQSVMAFDIYYKHLRTTRPAFSSFFTNHVASAMHRYWAAAFPDDYDEIELGDDWLSTFGAEIDYALDKADAMIAKLLEFVDRNPDYALWITSSMGQEATQAKLLKTQVFIEDKEKFLSVLGVESGQWEERPAMFPQFNLQVSDSAVSTLEAALRGLSIDNEFIRFRLKEGGFFSIDLGHENLHDREFELTLNGETKTMQDLGLDFFEPSEQVSVTAYHIPQGTLLTYDSAAAGSNGRRIQVSTLDVAPSILRNFGVNPLDHMKGSETLTESPKPVFQAAA